MLDISDVSRNEIRSISKENLIDGKEYEIYGYGRAYDRFIGQGYCSFIIIKDVRKYDSQSRLAVYESRGYDERDGNDVMIFNLAVDGEIKQFIVDDDIAYDNTYLRTGDPILFVTDTDGMITDISPIYNKYGLIEYDYYSFLDYAIENAGNLLNHSDDETYWRNLLSDSQSNDMNVVSGIVIDKSDSDITLIQGSGEDYFTGDLNGVNGVWVNLSKGLKLNCNEAYIYTYDYSATRTKLFTDKPLFGTPCPKSLIYTDENGDDWINVIDNRIYDAIVFAFARIDGNKVKEIYQIVGE